MKRRLILLFILIAALAALCCSAAVAEFDPLKVSMQLSKSTFTEPAEITVSIKISNTGESDMPGPVTLWYPNGKQVEEFGSPTLTVGGSQSWTGKWKVTQAQLDAGKITFSMQYTLVDDNGQLISKKKNFSKRIEYSGAVASCEVNRTIAPTTARKGQEVVVTYDVVNTGTVDITNVVIQENKSISTKSGKIDTVKAGEKASYSFKVTMGTKDLTSKATITYRADGEKKTVQKEAATIKYGEVKLTASLSADKRGGMTGETANLTLKLKNTGKSDFTNVTVTDPLLGNIFTNQVVPAGETVELTYPVAISETAKYQFTVTGRDDSGNEVETSTDSLTVTAVAPDQVVNLSVNATADREVIYQLPGIVRFTVAVTNNSAADVKDVSVGAKRGSDTVTLYTFPTILAGETREFTRDISVEMAGQYQFTASLLNQMRERQSFSSNIVRISFTNPTPVPTDAPLVTPPAPVYQELPTKDDLPSYYTTLPPVLRIAGIALAAIAGVGLIFLLIGGIRRAKSAAESAGALDHLDRTGTRDYEEPGKPERHAAPADTEPVPAEEVLTDDDLIDEAPEQPAAYEPQTYADQPDDGEIPPSQR